MQIPERIRCNGLSLVPRFDLSFLPLPVQQESPFPRGSNELMRAQFRRRRPQFRRVPPANSLSNCDFIHQRTFTASPLLRASFSPYKSRLLSDRATDVSVPGLSFSDISRMYVLFESRQHPTGTAFLIFFDLVSRYLTSQVNRPRSGFQRSFGFRENCRRNGQADKQARAFTRNSLTNAVTSPEYA